MPDLSPSSLAFAKLFLTFGCILIMLRLRIPLWLTIFAGCAVLALSSGLPARDWGLVPLGTLISADFLLMQAMLFGILILSGIQDASGQSRRFVEGLEHYIHSPRIRLILFPALVGLLPMPGGALFSCPMLEATSHGLNIDGQKKAHINYWFRHIWEVAWPLYPGYVLASSLLGISLLTLVRYTFPLAIFATATGWFFYLRKLDLPTQPERAPQAGEAVPSLPRVLLEALPMAVTLLGAVLFALVLNRISPDTPSQVPFILSLFLAVGVALFQTRQGSRVSLCRIVINPTLGKMLLLIYAIFVFKDTLSASGLISDLSRLGENRLLIYAIFIILPLVCGLLTGVMVGFVGACFPILIGILAHGGWEEQALPLIVVAMISGHAGQLLSPLHVCLVVSCEYFRASFMGVWKELLAPVAVQMCYGVLWALALYLMGAKLY